VGEGDADLLWALRPDRPWYLPSIALGEYRHGLLKSTRRAELEAWLESVENACAVLAADASEIPAHPPGRSRLVDVIRWFPLADSLHHR